MMGAVEDGVVEGEGDARWGWEWGRERDCGYVDSGESEAEGSSGVAGEKGEGSVGSVAETWFGEN